MSRLIALGAFVDVVRTSVSRDRSWLFFLPALPVLIMVVIGVTFAGDDQISLGVHSADRSPAAAVVLTALRDADGIAVREYDTRQRLDAATRGGGVSAGLLLSARLADAVEAGRTAPVELITIDAGDTRLVAATAVQGVLERVGARLVAARLVAERTGDAYAAELARAGRVGAGGGDDVAVRDVRDRAAPPSRFALTAPQNLVLFVFLNALTGAILLVEARRTGVLARIMSTPAGAETAVAGFALGWFGLALAQSVLLIAVGALVFGVDWGDPLAAAALVVVFALVGCGAGLVVGAVGRDADRVGAIAPTVGIVLAALGGCMAPLEVFPDTMRTIAGTVPHSWAIRAWEDLIFDAGGLGAITLELAVLAAFAVALLAFGTVVLRRELT